MDTPEHATGENIDALIEPSEFVVTRRFDIASPARSEPDTISNSDPNFLQFMADHCNDDVPMIEAEDDPEAFVRNIRIGPHMTVKQLTRLCELLSDDKVEVYCQLHAGDSLPRLHVMPRDESVPAFLRKQG